MSHVSRILSSAALVAILAGAASATPTPAESAKARIVFREAQQHYKLAEYAQALDGFKETYRLLEDPSLLFNIAQCYRQLNKKEEAIRFFRTFLHDAGDVPDRENVEQTVASLEKALRDEQAANASPPVETPAPPVAPAPVLAPAPASVQASAHPAAREKTPVYKRWWLWTTVAVVAAGAGVGLGLGLTRTPPAPSAATQDGTLHLFSLSY
jgi:tetratricopeptide (TPR) repeat protein